MRKRHISEEARHRILAGALKSNTVRRQRRVERENAYKPGRCLYCQKDIPYTKRLNTFCNRSCAISYNNRGVQRNRKSGTYAKKACRYCGQATSNAFFCSIKCSHEAQQRKIDAAIRAGTYKCKCYAGNKILRRFLENERGAQCESCKLSHWQGQRIPLNVHHIDGDAANNLLINLKLLCLNCHGLTDNYGRKNNHLSTRTYRYASA